MAKLVLLLDDGTAQDILLARERIALGRRADNDVCLPDPAVSGEHAAITTILSDSFLEDLGSTNGTYVNGTRVQKHVLRDSDVIELGRQRLRYVADEGSGEARAVPRSGAAARTEASPVALDVDTVAGAAVRRRDNGSHRVQTAAGAGARAPGHAVGVIVDDGAHASVRRPRSDATTIGAELIVLTGPRAGRSLALVKDVTSIGRMGVQVALVRKTAEGYVLSAADGSAPPELNGAPVEPPGALLGRGDVIEVAGARVEFCAPDAFRT